MVLSTIAAPAAGFGFPEIAAGAQARVRAQNAASGAGRPHISLTICNDQSIVQKATACAIQAVNGHYAAVIGVFTPFGAEVIPILAKAGIPFVGNEPPAEDVSVTSPVAYVLNGGSTIDSLAMAVEATRLGCANLGILSEGTAAGVAILNQDEAAAKVMGITKVEGATIPLTEADPTAALQNLISGGATCIYHGVDATQELAVAQTLHTIAPTVKQIASAITYPNTTVARLGSIVNGLYLVSSMYPVNDASTSAMRQWGTDWSSLKSSAPKALFGLQAWTATQLIIDAAGRVSGTVTASTLRQALNGIKGLNLGTFPGDYTAADSNIPKLARVGSLTDSIGVVHNGQIVYAGAVDARSGVLNEKLARLAKEFG
jgi:branched-chain amino acid transport system substrate-binding protein